MQNCTDSVTSRFSKSQTNMDVSSRRISIKVAKCTKYEIKLIISLDFLFVSNILSFPSIICADKRDLGYKAL